MACFHNGKKPGQRVTYLAYNGMGRHGPEYKKATGKAVIVSDDKIVVNAGGRHGRAVVVTESNFVS